MKMYVSARGQKTLFFDGKLTKQEWKKICAMVKWYFNWQKIKVYCDEKEIVLMDATEIERLRNLFFGPKKERVVS